MGIVETSKEVFNLVQKLDNIELLRRMAELQQQAFDLQEENRNLKEKLALREQMVFRKNAYWNGDKGPFCSRCFDAENLTVRMHARHGADPHCPQCRHAAVDPDREPPKPVRRPSMFDRHRRGGY